MTTDFTFKTSYIILMLPDNHRNVEILLDHIKMDIILSYLSSCYAALGELFYDTV